MKLTPRRSTTSVVRSATSRRHGRCHRRLVRWPAGGIGSPPRARSADAGPHGAVRSLAAAGLALTISIAAALLAVWLVLPPRGGPGPGASSQPSSTPRPTPNPALLYSAPPTATPLPTFPAYALFGAAAPWAGPGQRGQRSRPARPDQRHIEGHRRHGRPRERPGLPAAGRRIPVRLYHQRRTGVRGHLDHDRDESRCGGSFGRYDGAVGRPAELCGPG